MAATRHHCINHADVEAVSHCAMCHVPMCAGCVAVRDGNAAYCSASCRAEHGEFQRKFRDIKLPGPGILRRIAGVVVPLAAVVGLLYAGRAFGLGFCDRLLKLVGL